MGLSLGTDEGIQLWVSGFTDKQPELLNAALKGLRVNPSEQSLAQAVDRFVRSLENRKRELPVSQLGGTLSRLVSSGYYDEASMLEVVRSLTLDEFNAFVDGLLRDTLVRIGLYGNYDAKDAERIADSVRRALPDNVMEDRPYVRGRTYAPQAGRTVVFNSDIPVEDLGMMLLYAAPEATVANEAAGMVLARHIRNRAFDTLRTQEQLGYAAGGLTTKLQDHPVIGFYIQTPVKAPAAMLKRFESFAEEYEVMLEEMTPEQFANLKSGVLTQLTEPPTNLADEAGPFIGDWNRELRVFDPGHHD